MAKSMGKSNSILIVDDETVNIMALVDILRNDYTLYTERDGKNCLDTAARLQPDLILLDILMPEMNGFEVMENLQKDSRTKDIPIIFVTGLSQSDDEVRGFSLGAVDYISKPFSAQVVKMRVQHQMKILGLIREIQTLSVTDPLTGIGNRRYFNTLVHQEWERAKRNFTPISFMLLDIDDFKQFNDSFGHLNGDIALQSVAHIISSEITRSSDKIARWGGEEFAIILPDTDTTGARRVSENIRTAVENAEIPIDDGEVKHATVSIGIHTHIPERCDEYSASNFVSDADKALFRAKRTGKNRVCAFNDMGDNQQSL
ncbi:MAG: diguanylate cyclase [Defluviitaleaceae bacterium]|nr:diguanylate cyclase [Defluviitaleaceae bacterium]